VDEDRGLVVEMNEGPELIFGDATRVRDKWDAAARVLADPAAEGAAYVDVRLPDRPAAGGLAADTVTPVAPAGGLGEAAPNAQAPAPAAPTTEQATPDVTGQAAPAPAPAQPAPTAPQQAQPAPEQAAPAPQQAPPAQLPPAEGTGGGGAAVNPQP
jgi:hypothetical protein